ncbi:hypothetical protein FEM48_Zijuj01G0084400 [Ziziphus jujuba var. spinosa]|uniref:Uncharacterized protein n=1 Tax=Ziziphus jujuba var. spinosa TaxID=714518 RepID=A0A978W067_ZIZJJ|nr:hypothetical protein FEM48_Zijuj01G0084400 [Ziziphus jujuba var. spinosa]
MAYKDVGTGCVFRRYTLYGYDAPVKKKPPSRTCNCWPKWCYCLCCGSKKKKSGKSKKETKKKSKHREASKQINALENIEKGIEDDWWRNDQFWVIGGVASHIFALVQGLLKVLGGVNTNFTVTSKAADDGEFSELYIFKWTSLLIPPTTLLIINIVGVVVGISDAINNRWKVVGDENRIQYGHFPCTQTRLANKGIFINLLKDESSSVLPDDQVSIEVHLHAEVDDDDYCRRARDNANRQRANIVKIVKEKDKDSLQSFGGVRGIAEALCTDLELGILGDEESLEFRNARESAEAAQISSTQAAREAPIRRGPIGYLKKYCNNPTSYFSLCVLCCPLRSVSSRRAGRLVGMKAPS